MTPDRKPPMSKLLAYIRANAIALCALFIALGGTSYAAIAIPAGSVGNRQLKNHSVTPVKLDGGRTAGYVADWAQIGDNGVLLEARPRGARILGWNGTPNSPGIGGSIQWKNRLSNTCIPMVSVDQPSADAVPVSANLNGPVNRPYVSIHEVAPRTVNVAVICPIP